MNINRRNFLFGSAAAATAVFTDQRHNAFEWAKRVKGLELVP